MMIELFDSGPHLVTQLNRIKLLLAATREVAPKKDVELYERIEGNISQTLVALKGRRVVVRGERIASISLRLDTTPQIIAKKIQRQNKASADSCLEYARDERGCIYPPNLFPKEELRPHGNHKKTRAKRRRKRGT